MPSRVTALVVGLFFCGCGAPKPEPAAVDCHSFEGQFPGLIKLLQSPEMQPVVDLIQTQLLDAGLLQPAVSAVIAMLEAAPPPPSTPSAPSTTNASTGPSVTRSLGLYVVGDPPASIAHYDVTTSIGDTLTGCHDELLALVDDLLNTPVPAGCALTDSGCDLAWHALSLDVRAVVSTPAIRDLLGSAGGTSLTEDDFVSFIQTFTSYFGSPNLDFSAVDTFVQSEVISQVSDPQLRTALQDLLSTIEQVLSPKLGIQAALASGLACFEAKDPSTSVYRMIYALLSDASFQTTEIVASSPAPVDATVLWVGQLTQYLRAHEDATDAITNAGAMLLTRANASVMLPGLLKADDAGLFANASQLLQAQACQ